MAAFLNVCRFNPTAGGTTDWTYSTAVQGYQSPTAAGVVNGTVYKYRAESSDLSQWEMGEGAYNTGTGVLARTTVLYNSSGTGTGAGQTGAGTKINFSAAPQVAVVELKEDLLSVTEANSFTAAQKVQAQTNIGVREALTAARTYYVRTDGSDSNTGLADTAGGAFLTIQKAMDAAALLDIGAYSVTIQARSGTYAGGVSVPGPWHGSGTVTLVGDNTTPSNVTLSSTTGRVINVANGGTLTVSGFKVTTTGSGTDCISAEYGATIKITNKMEYGACLGNHLRAIDGGRITITSGYTISGGVPNHIFSNGPGASIRIQSVGTITLTGTPAFSVYFAQVRYGALLAIEGNTFSGAATGTRHYVDLNGVINTAGAGLAYLPGNVNGAADDTNTGGRYA